MDSSKNKQSKKSGFERKEINGKVNPKYVDLLDEDKPLAGQKFVCMSFCSPEKILKEKEIFFFEEFLKNWDFNKSMEKFLQFINFISFKYNLSFEDLNKDFKDFRQNSSFLRPLVDQTIQVFKDLTLGAASLRNIHRIT